MKVDVLCVGHAACDLTMAVDHHPDPDEKMTADSLVCCGGGPSANGAVTVARLGGTAAWCGYLGFDLYGEAHIQELQAEGVDTSLAVRGSNPSPLSAILAKPDGSRCVINHKSDTPWLAADAVDFSAVEAKSMLLDGHEPLLSLPLVMRAKAAAIPVVLDAGSVRKGTESLAPLVDYLVASRRFASDYCDTSDPEKAVKALAEVAPCAVVTLGHDGLVWAAGGRSGSLPAFAVDAVDSTGAGDAFHGAFALGVARGMAWEHLLAYASAAGALTVTKLGARIAIPIAAEVEQLLNGGR